MSIRSDIFDALSVSGLPGTHIAWPIGNAPDLPWFVYEVDSWGETYADNKNYHVAPTVTASLYEAEADPKVEQAFEDAVAAIGPYSTTETWLADENALVIQHTFTYLPKE